MKRYMEKMFRKYSEILLVTLSGLLILGGLNLLMVMTAPDAWTDTHYGPWTAFHSGFHLSGFDQLTYVMITQWRPLYTHLRHPILAHIIWPLAEINTWLKEVYGINCAIYVLATVWTLVSTLSWVFLYKIFRNLVELSIRESLLLNAFYYSFAYVMLAMFAPDHMILSMTTLIVMLYISGKAWKQGKILPVWKALLLYFIGAGVSTTNSVKIWLIDVTGRWRKSEWGRILCRCLLYFIPTALLVALYFYEENTAYVEEWRYQRRVTIQAQKRDSVKFVTQRREAKRKEAVRKSKQVADNPLFEWTDTSIPIVPTLVENIFGEGFLLHKDYLLCDANVKDQRPVIVEYSDWYSYLVEALIICLFVAGIVMGRRERLLWMCMMPFLVDMLIHVGLRFALTDVYIMTAHWAFVIPVAVAFLIKKAKPILRLASLSVVVVLTAFLWWHNLSLIAGYLFNK